MASLPSSSQPNGSYGSKAFKKPTIDDDRLNPAESEHEHAPVTASSKRKHHGRRDSVTADGPERKKTKANCKSCQDAEDSLAHSERERRRDSKRQRAEVAKLRAQLASIQKKHDEEIAKLVKEKASIRESSLKLHQDCMLDVVMQQNRDRSEAERERYRLGRKIITVEAAKDKEIEGMKTKMQEMSNKHAVHCTEHQKKHEGLQAQLEATRSQLNQERSNHAKALSENSYFQQSLDHVQNLLQSADGMLMELQQINIEERAERERRSRGLPPAYGSLDDIEVQAPWGKFEGPSGAKGVRHEDGGSFDVANMKLLVRNCFSHVIIDAQLEADRNRDHQHMGVRLAAGSTLFHTVTVALSDACRSMANMLSKANDMETFPRKKLKGRQIADKENSCPPAEPFSKTRRAYIADRNVKLVIDCVWKLIAAIDVRCFTIKFAHHVKANVGLLWREIDDIMKSFFQGSIFGEGENKLVEANFNMFEFSPGSKTSCQRCNNKRCSGHCDRLNELQFYFTMIKPLCKRLDNMTDKEHLPPFFGETYNWLSENIDTERRLAADACDPLPLPSVPSSATPPPPPQGFPPPSHPPPGLPPSGPPPQGFPPPGPPPQGSPAAGLPPQGSPAPLQRHQSVVLPRGVNPNNLDPADLARYQAAYDERHYREVFDRAMRDD